MVKRKKSYIKKINQLDTLSVHAGVKTDPLTGAVMTPIYATSTYAHDRPGEHTNENRFLFDSNLKPKPAVFAIKKALIDKNTSLVLYD